MPKHMNVRTRKSSSVQTFFQMSSDADFAENKVESFAGMDSSTKSAASMPDLPALNASKIASTKTFAERMVLATINPVLG